MRAAKEAQAIALFEAYFAAEDAQKPAVLAGIQSAALRAEVESLIQTMKEATSFMELSGPGLAAEHLDPSQPETIGDYQIIDTIGEGGMGRVYLAEQYKPVYRQVALKTLHSRITNPSLIERFRFEFETLAQLNHPNLACVFDGGIDQDQPFFTMEYFPGEAIHLFCEKQQLDLERRLELMIEVCEGIAFANQNGVIHCDIKPSNVLVRQVNGQAYVKVIDFGVAKRIFSDQPVENQPKTETNLFLGTPIYMSPEQFEPKRRVDTRTDVYGLGVVLYHLLCDAPPFSPDSNVWQLVEYIRRNDPLKPSDVVSITTGHRAFKARRLRGDLDWIALKCLARDPDKRYQSATQLAEDLRAFLDQKPVTAGPPTLGYRTGKFVRRHRIPVILSSALMLVALILGISQNQARLKQQEAQSLEATFLKSLGLINPYGDDAPVNRKEILDAQAQIVFEDLSNQPLPQARRLIIIANNYSSLGSYREAVSLAGQALALFQAHLEPDDGERLHARERLAFFHLQNDHLDLAAQQFSALRADLEGTGGDQNWVFLKAGRGLANVHMARNEIQQAASLLEETWKAQEDLYGADQLETVLTQLVMGNVYRRLNQDDAARRAYQSVADHLSRSDPPQEAERLSALHNLAVLDQDQGKDHEAIKQLQVVARARETKLGPGHPDALISWNALAYSMIRQNQKQEALDILNRIIPLQEAALGSNHRDLLNSRINKANLLADMGDLEQAETFARDLEKRLVARYGKANSETLKVMNNRADYLKRMGRFDEATPLLRDVMAIAEGQFGRDHKSWLLPACTLGEVMIAQEGYADAFTILDEVIERGIGVFGEDHLYLAIFRGLAGHCLLKLGRRLDAGPYLSAAQQGMGAGSTKYHKQVEQDLEALNQ